jgi:glycosyltransferase involved in cell wall biosynthesis
VRKKVYCVFVGPIHPLVGGVSVSVSSYYNSLKDEGLEVTNIQGNQVHHLLFFRPKFVHFNYSLPSKRFFGTLIGKLIGAKVVHTIHGNEFSIENKFNALTVALSHKIFFLNALVAKKNKLSVKDKGRIVTPVLAINTKRSDSYIPIIIKEDKYSYVLVYANSNASINGVEVYGIKFIIEMLPEIGQLGFRVVIVDPSGAYGEDIAVARKQYQVDVIYLNYPVDFKSLLKDVDLYVRPTSSDGQSVAVLESLALGTPVLASDVVPRPSGVTTYKFYNRKDFLKQLSRATMAGAMPPKLTSVKKYKEELENE